jgi:tetratricopeptide (TPR) repeat protein
LIDWSYDLLSASERLLLCRLSVFAGGWLLEAAEAVCTDEGAGMDVLDLLTQLVNKSLVVVDCEQGQEARYRLLETVRQYAREKLAETGEGARVRTQHLAYFLQFAEEAEPHLFRLEQLDWLAQLEREHDNLRAALEWALDRVGDEPPGPPEAGLRLANALWRFWLVRGYWQEGSEALGRALAVPGQPSRTVARARALGHAYFFEDNQEQQARLADESLALCRALGDKPGIAFALHMKGFQLYLDHNSLASLLLEESLAIYSELGDKWGIAITLYNLGQIAQINEYNIPAARHFYEESLKLHRETGDRRGMAFALNDLGLLALDQGDLPAAGAFLEESLSLARELGDKDGTAMYLTNLGVVALGQADYPQAVKLFEEGLIIAREVGDKQIIAGILNGLGRVVRFRGDYRQAAELQTESLSIARQMDDKLQTAGALFCLGEVARLQGDHTSARAFYTEAVKIARELNDRGTMTYLIEESAALSAAQGGVKRAATLFGAAQALRTAIHNTPMPVERLEIDRNIAHVRAQLGEAAFDAAWAEGQTMTFEQAISCVMEQLNPSNDQHKG